MAARIATGRYAACQSREEEEANTQHTARSTQLRSMQHAARTQLRRVTDATALICSLLVHVRVCMHVIAGHISPA